MGFVDFGTAVNGLWVRPDEWDYGSGPAVLFDGVEDEEKDAGDEDEEDDGQLSQDEIDRLIQELGG